MGRHSAKATEIPPLNSYAELSADKAHVILIKIAMTVDDLGAHSFLQSIGTMADYNIVNGFIRDYIYRNIPSTKIVMHLLDCNLPPRSLEECGLYQYLEIAVEI